MIIDIYADIACPWCYIGEQRFMQALRQRPEVAPELRWQPFQLQPDLPMTGVPWADFARQKFGGTARAAQMFDHVAGVGAGDGLEFRFDRVATAANTRDAHRLILLAAERGAEWQMAEALFKAYFTDGRDLNSADDLVAVAGEAGVEAGAVHELLAGDAYVTEVRASQALAAQLGISGVPFYVINGRYGLSGAQPVELFLQVLDTYKDEPVDLEA